MMLLRGPKGFHRPVLDFQLSPLAMIHGTSSVVCTYEICGLVFVLRRLGEGCQAVNGQNIDDTSPRTLDVARHE